MGLKFFKVALEPIKNEDVLKFAYSRFNNQRAISAVDDGTITLADRMGDGKCESCGHDTWMILPISHPMVDLSGKSFIQCMNCGDYTHL